MIILDNIDISRGSFEKEEYRMNLGYIKKAKVGLNYFLKRTRLPAGQIVGFTIEPTNICNLRCVYCPQSDHDNHFINGRGYMSFETFKSILDNLLADFTPNYVSLHRDGEPMLNKELDQFIQYTVSKGLKAIMSSNCTLLTKERSEALLQSGLSLIKTDFCADKKLYEELRAGAKWDTTYEGMLNILSLARTMKKSFQLNITDISTHGVSKTLAGERTSALGKLFNDYNDDVVITRVHFHNALEESVTSLGRRQDMPKKYTLCHHPWVHIVVDFKGNVVPCCRDLRSECICGSLLNNKMSFIWNDKPFLDIRTALKDQKPEEINICGKCDLPYAGSYSGTGFASRVKNLFFSKMWKR
ncbi:MAG: radical SAM protein [Candidatus Latescibacterota bacterium]